MFKAVPFLNVTVGKEKNLLIRRIYWSYNILKQINLFWLIFFFFPVELIDFWAELAGYFRTIDSQPQDSLSNTRRIIIAIYFFQNFWRMIYSGELEVIMETYIDKLLGKKKSALKFTQHKSYVESNITFVGSNTDSVI